MANDRVTATLQEVAGRLALAKATLPDAEDLVKVLEEAGEDSTEVRALITETRTRIAQWERTLQARGVTVPTVTPEKEE